MAKNADDTETKDEVLNTCYRVRQGDWVIGVTDSASLAASTVRLMELLKARPGWITIENVPPSILEDWRRANRLDEVRVSMTCPDHPELNESEEVPVL
jgi:hypothetical protein